MSEGQSLELLAPVPADLGEVLDVALERGRAYADEGVAKNTRLAYHFGMRHYARWCEGRGVAPVPASPDLLVAYLGDTGASAKRSTINVRLAAINAAHSKAGVPSPTRDPHVRATVRGIERVEGTPVDKRQGLYLADLVGILEAIPWNSPRASTRYGRLADRDRALLLVGWYGAFRRSELVGLDVADLDIGPRGVIVLIKRSKTDKKGRGRRIGIPRIEGRGDLCPVAALERWLLASSSSAGPVFRAVDRHGNVAGRRLTPGVVASVVKRRARAAGLGAGRLAGHSLRRGFATEAFARRADRRLVRKQTGHRSDRMLEEYEEEGSIWIDNAAALMVP